MSNKSEGTRFEKVFADILSDRGYWAHCLRDNHNGQPFDVIACYNNQPYAFDCKECSGDRFVLSRMEENQILAMRKFIKTGNKNAYFAILMNGNIYVVHYLVLMERYGKEASIPEKLLKVLSEETILCEQE
jgi:Holliday junction resolvase